MRGNGTNNYIGGSVSTANGVYSFKEKDKKAKKIIVPTTLELPLDQAEDLEISEFVSFVNLSDTTKKKKLIEEDFDPKRYFLLYA